MTPLIAAVLMSLFNLALAANIYLSLRGWLVPYEPSGMPLIFHVILTAPIVLVTTIWLFFLSKSGQCSAAFWKINALGMFISCISVQTGVVYYGYDKEGLVLTGALALSLLALLTSTARQRPNS